jgi:phage terminase large subunit GpA-like protein
LEARREKYAADVPDGVGVLVAAVDVQTDRLEVAVKGFGAEEESWLIDHAVIPGDPAEDRVWSELDAYLAKPFTNAKGRPCPIECAVVDIGGQHTERVYRFTEFRRARHIYAIKGMGGPREIVGRPSVSERYRTRLYIVGTDTAKDMIFGRMRVRVPGPGFMHLPAKATREYLDTLTAEKAFRKWQRGRGFVRVWEKIRDRNEGLDLEVYCLAALHILGRALIRLLPERAAAWAAWEKGKGDGPKTPEGGPKDAAAGLRRRSGWVSGWRRGRGVTS